MAGYKHIERCIGDYISNRYRNVVEIGMGKNSAAACRIRDAGIPVRCTDIHAIPVPAGITFRQDDIFAPDRSFYDGADLIYSIRPAVEMIPSMIALAETIPCDLLVYHLGFESFQNGAEVIDCGVLLHRYVRA